MRFGNVTRKRGIVYVRAGKVRNRLVDVRAMQTGFQKNVKCFRRCFWSSELLDFGSQNPIFLRSRCIESMRSNRTREPFEAFAGR